jgi:Mg2+-importing ATPase
MAVALAARQDLEAVLDALGSRREGLDAAEVVRRQAVVGPNAVRTHHTRGWQVLRRQFRSALLLLLLVTALLSYFLGERTDAVIIGVILAASVGLGFANEYRAERTAEELHSGVHHTVVVQRNGIASEVDVTELVPGDVVCLQLGAVVPADIRLLETNGLECNESVLTGETAPVEKNVQAVGPHCVLAELNCCALMGTVITAGSGLGLVVATGAEAEFGRIALALGQRQPETEFQRGLRRFSVLLLQVAVVLAIFIVVANLVLSRPLLDSVLFALAIAVGITPQLLPAVVSTSLATGSRRLAQQKVLVKRLVCIEDLGDIDVLVTDKTGTLTESRLALTAALDPHGEHSHKVLETGLLATETDHAGGNPLDTALWASGATPPAHQRLGLVPFDHDRRMTSTLVDLPIGRRIVVKGAPESVLACCPTTPERARSTLRQLFADGARVVAIATRSAPDVRTISAADERDFDLAGFLVFQDTPKPDAAAALRRLADLGITVKVATGDNAIVAQKVCSDLGLTTNPPEAIDHARTRGPSGHISATATTLTGSDIDRLDDTDLIEATETAAIFARVSPEQKARLVALLRRRGRAVAFLGDGVNDALALHAADVGISVHTASDVAKDAADVLLLEKDLAVLAGGVEEGRRTFANTIKYILMGTSSNFGNMFSAAAAAAILPFLPMLPSQILLNNLLYDTSQLAIPTDQIDPEQLRAPSHWDLTFIRRFMLFFGPISSLFDFPPSPYCWASCTRRPRRSAPAGSSNRWPPKPWSSSPSGPGECRSSAAARAPRCQSPH